MKNPNSIFVQIGEFFYNSIESSPNRFRLYNSKKPSVYLEYQDFTSIADMLVFLQKNYPASSNCPAIFLTESEYNQKTALPENPNAIYLKSSFEYKYWISFKLPGNVFSFNKLRSDGSINPNVTYSGEQKTLTDALYKAILCGALPVKFSEIQFSKIID